MTRHDPTQPRRRAWTKLVAGCSTPVALAALGLAVTTAGPALAQAAPTVREFRVYSPVTERVLVAQKYKENNDAKVTFMSVEEANKKTGQDFVTRWVVDGGVDGDIADGAVVTLKSANTVNGLSYCLDGHFNKNPLYAHQCNGSRNQKWRVYSGTCPGVGAHYILTNEETLYSINDYKGKAKKRGCNNAAVRTQQMN